MLLTIFGILIGLFGLYIVVCNYGSLYAAYRRDGSTSTVPLIGGLFLAAGLALIPQTRPWWWVGLVVDPVVLWIPGFAVVLRQQTQLEAVAGCRGLKRSGRPR